MLDRLHTICFYIHLRHRRNSRPGGGDKNEVADGTEKKKSDRGQKRAWTGAPQVFSPGTTNSFFATDTLGTRPEGKRRHKTFRSRRDGRHDHTQNDHDRGEKVLADRQNLDPRASSSSKKARSRQCRFCINRLQIRSRSLHDNTCLPRSNLKGFFHETVCAKEC